MVSLKNLIDGFKKFRKAHYASNKTVFEKLAKSQKPNTLIIACSDSRVDPAILSSSNLGEIFVVRNVANIIPEYQSKQKSFDSTIAALEFAVNILPIKNIIILGHSGCAGVKSIVNYNNRLKNFKFLNYWLENGQKIKNLIKKNKVKAIDLESFSEKEMIKMSVNNVKKYPWIKKKMKNNQIMVLGWYFNIKECALYQFDTKNNSYKKIKT